MEKTLGKLIQEYTQTTNMSEKVQIEFLKTNRNRLGTTLVREMILNCRTHFKTHQSSKIVHSFKKYIMNKNKKHNSDLAIGYNILKNVTVPKIDEEMIIKFLYEQLADKLPNVENITLDIKKYLLLDYIKKNILIKQ